MKAEYHRVKVLSGNVVILFKFLPKLVNRIGPLAQIVETFNTVAVGHRATRSFDNSKKLLTSSQLLVHLDPELEIVLACDASDYGIGAVLSHHMTDGSEMPIGFVSRTLTKAEKNYVFTIRKGGFSLYLWHKAFSLIPVWPQVYLTDRSPVFNNIV